MRQQEDVISNTIMNCEDRGVKEQQAYRTAFERERTSHASEIAEESARCITAIVAIVVGLVFTFAAQPMEVLLPQSLAPIRGGSQTALQPRRTLLEGINNAMLVATNDFFEMGRYLIIGTMLAAAMQTTLSQDVLVSLGQGPVQSVLVMQLLAFVLSVCSTVDAFLALAFAGTFTTGSILAFLTFGPMVDIKSMLMFMGVFRQRVVFYLVLVPLLLTAFIGIWLNLNIVIFTTRL